MNRFRVAPGRSADFEAAWADRRSYLATVSGFVAFKLLKGDEGVYISHSSWENREAFVAWTESEAFARAHRQGLPDGVLAGPPEVSLYDVVLSEDVGRGAGAVAGSTASGGDG